MAGFIKLYRELIDKPIWKCSSSQQKAILITILCMVNHEEKEWIFEGKKYICSAGQKVTSLKSIAEASGTTIRNVRTALKNLEQTFDFLTSKSTNKNRLVTVKNWTLYQSKDSKATSSLTSNRQASDKQVTTNKNDKNDKNDKKKNISYFADENLNNLFLDFLEQRTKLKAVNSDRAVKTLLKILEPLSDEQKVFEIERSIAGSWKSIFPKDIPKKTDSSDADRLIEEMKASGEI